MSRGIRFWCVCSVLALGLLIPALVSAQEIPGAASPAAAGEQLLTPDQAPQGDAAPDQEPITLEELKKLVGPHNVCGATCGPGRPSCYTLCGDAAACVSGHCIWL